MPDYSSHYNQRLIDGPIDGAVRFNQASLNYESIMNKVSRITLTSTTTRALTWSEMIGRIIVLEGTLSGDVIVEIPSLDSNSQNAHRPFIIQNKICGGFRAGIKATSGFTVNYVTYGSTHMFTVASWNSEVAKLVDFRTVSIISKWSPGAITSNRVLIRQVLAEPVAFHDKMGGSKVHAVTAPTGNVTLDVKVDGITKSSCTINAGQNTGSFATTSPFVANAGEILTFVAPASADATLAGVSATLTGVQDGYNY